MIVLASCFDSLTYCQSSCVSSRSFGILRSYYSLESKADSICMVSSFSFSEVKSYLTEAAGLILVVCFGSSGIGVSAQLNANFYDWLFLAEQGTLFMMSMVDSCKEGVLI